MWGNIFSTINRSHKYLISSYKRHVRLTFYQSAISAIMWNINFDYPPFSFVDLSVSISGWRIDYANIDEQLNKYREFQYECITGYASYSKTWSIAYPGELFDHWMCRWLSSTRQESTLGTGINSECYWKFEVFNSLTIRTFSLAFIAQEHSQHLKSVILHFLHKLCTFLSFSHLLNFEVIQTEY